MEKVSSIPASGPSNYCYIRLRLSADGRVDERREEKEGMDGREGEVRVEECVFFVLIEVM